MSERDSGHEPGDEEIHNEYVSLWPEGSELQELGANIRLAGQQLYSTAREYAARPGDIEAPGLLPEFMQELSLLDLPRGQVIKALEYAAELAGGAMDSGRANSMDPFLDDIHSEDEAEEI